jgi:chromatin segregation and condensation protein Rec8/ScpA/Scc1 (kleisin family)
MSDFVKLVNKMRRAQKMYFKTKTRSSLEEAKRLEDSVDRMLADFGFQEVKAKQLELFGNGSKPN